MRVPPPASRQTLLPALLLGISSCPVVLHAQTPDPTQPPPGQHIVLAVQGRGSQIYACQQDHGVFQWIFIAPVARLFDPAGVEVGTHGDGPVWMVQDGSSIRGAVLAKVPSPEPGSIPWLLLQGAQSPDAPVPNAGLLSNVQFIRRSDTHGGSAPATGCDAAHNGDQLRVPYTAAYTFYSSSAQPPAATLK